MQLTEENKTPIVMLALEEMLEKYIMDQINPNAVKIVDIINMLKFVTLKQ